MSQTPKRTPGKGKGRSQPAVKGCCCKRSQCIKNYCDCYQSMMVCTQFCRCVGCRNTEERMAVEPRTPARNASAVKRDRAAAMSAKAAAAAAKEGIKVQVPPVGSSTPIVPTIVPVQQPAIAPLNIVRVAPDAFNVVVPQAPSQHLMPPVVKEVVELAPATIDPAKALPFVPPEVEPKSTEPVDAGLHKTYNLFVQKINEALLECVLIRGFEAEQLGLSHIQVGRLVLAEFLEAYQEVLQKIVRIS